MAENENETAVPTFADVSQAVNEAGILPINSSAVAESVAIELNSESEDSPRGHSATYDAYIPEDKRDDVWDRAQEIADGREANDRKLAEINAAQGGVAVGPSPEPAPEPLPPVGEGLYVREANSPARAEDAVYPETTETENPNKVDGYDTWSKSDLETEAENRGLSKSGTKAELAKRLQENDVNEGEDPNVA